MKKLNLIRHLFLAVKNGIEEKSWIYKIRSLFYLYFKEKADPN